MPGTVMGTGGTKLPARTEPAVGDRRVHSPSSTERVTTLCKFPKATEQPSQVSRPGEQEERH